MILICLFLRVFIGELCIICFICIIGVYWMLCMFLRVGVDLIGGFLGIRILVFEKILILGLFFVCFDFHFL